MNYVSIKGEATGNEAHFRFIENYEDDSFMLTECEPLAEEWPEDAAYRMSDDYPENIELVDFLHVLDSALVVSTETRDFLNSANVGGIEYLPVKALNHKGRPVKRKYFVANVLEKVDCIDVNATKFKWHPIDTEIMAQVSNLTIDEMRIPTGIAVFRMQHLPEFIWIRKDLVDQLASAGLKGYRVVELKDLKV